MSWSCGVRHWTVGLLLTSALLVGCGGDANEESATTRYSTEQIVSAAHLSADGGSYRTASGCQVSTILLGPGQVKLYEDAGSAVAKTPDESAGVELTTATNACRREIENALQDL